MVGVIWLRVFIWLLSCVVLLVKFAILLVYCLVWIIEDLMFDVWNVLGLMIGFDAFDI